MLTRLLHQLRQLHDGLRQTEQIYMVLVAVVIGMLGGLCAVGFRMLIRGLNHVFWHQGQYTLAYLEGLPFWWKLAAPTLGGLVVGYIVHRFAREAKGHGVPEVIESVALRGGRMRPRVVAATMLASGVCIGSGGSAGREGPIVQIGSALGSTIGQWLKVDQRRLRTLVGCGAAAGIAATFNAPVGGALFAVEIILGDFGVTQFSPIVISSVAGTVVSQHFLGDFPAFQVPAYSLVHAAELPAYAVLGVLAGLVALAFVRTLYWSEDFFDAMPIYPPLRAALGGLIIGVIGIWLPHVFGVGYEAVNEVLNGNIVWQFMLLLVAAKILAVSITLGSGGSGGVFAPSLFIGAMLGGAAGTVIHTLWPASTAEPGAYALVGMGAVVAAGTHAPITAILIIFELTGDYKIILPLMIACIIATLLSTRLYRASIYTLKLLRRGIDVRRGRAVNVLQHVRVRELMRPDIVTVRPEEGLSGLIGKFIDHPGSTVFVTDEEDTLEGLVTTDQIRPVMQDPAAFAAVIIAQDVMTEGDFPRVRPDDSLADVMRHLELYRGEVPVLENGRLVGVIWPEDVIERYNTEVFKRDMAGSMAAALASEGRQGLMPAASETVVAEVDVPARFVGRTIGELNIRQDFGVSVLMIKRMSDRGEELLNASPTADYVFAPGDVMLVLGHDADLPNLRRGIPRPAHARG